MSGLSTSGRIRIRRERLSSTLLQAGLLPQAKVNGSKTLLLYNTMWGESADRPAGHPPGVALTTSLRRFRQARVVVFHLPSLGAVDHLEKADGQIWVAWWMEPAELFPLIADTGFMSRFDLTMSYSRDSDVVTPYFGWEEERLRSPPIPKHGLAALFLSGDTETNQRTAYAAELMQHIEIDSFGKRLRNRSLPDDRGAETKRKTIAGYKFTLAFENANADDLVTEKLYDPLAVGSVPIYMGAPNVRDLVPSPACLINTDDFSGPEALAQHLLALDADEEAYSKHLAWKRMPFQAEFQDLLEQQRIPPLDRLWDLVEARFS